MIVGGTPDGRGVVAAANYIVRKFGIHSAMPTTTALRLCPQVIVVRPRMDHYAAVSEQIRQIFLRFTPLVEPLSLDEAFLDVTGTEGLFGSPGEIGRRIKQEIRDEVGLVASVGIAPNKFLAKVASDLEKPDALVTVDPDRIQEFLDPLPVSRIWGVGRVTDAAFAKLNIRTIHELRGLGLATLRQHFGEHGEHFWRLCQGIDNRVVVPDREAKSISNETTFATDLTDRDVLRAWLLELTEHVGRRLRRHALQGRTVQIKVRFASFQTITRAQTLPRRTDCTQTLWQTAATLLDSVLTPRTEPIRLLGVGVSRFEAGRSRQLSLFEEPAHAPPSDLDTVADQIQARFGTPALGRASGLLHGARHAPAPRPRRDVEPEPTEP